jgi:hypothetical protein
MEFHRWEPTYNLLQAHGILDRELERKSFATTMMAHAIAQYRMTNNPVAQSYGANAFNMHHMEYLWHVLKRPYYHVYPAVIPLLTKLKLSIPASAIRPPRYCVLNLRFPKNKDLGLHAIYPPTPEKTYPLRTVMLISQGAIDPTGDVEKMAKMMKSEELDSAKATRGFSIWMDFGEAENSLKPAQHLPGMVGKRWLRTYTGRMHPKYIMPVYTYQNTVLRDDRPDSDTLTLEDRLAEVKTDPTASGGLEVQPEMLTKIIRLCMSVWLIDDDPDILEPDVLAKHRDKYKAILEELDKYQELDPEHPLVQKLLASREKLIQQAAARRGEAGWNLGKKYEAGNALTPCLIPPHPCLFWTGHGRSIPKIRTRRGHLRNREVAEAVPSGFDNSTAAV